MKFVLDRERQEADRKRVEGQGIADFQNIVARGISDQLLTWKAIEVAHELSKSPNAKVVVLGDKSGLPIILSDEARCRPRRQRPQGRKTRRPAGGAARSSSWL
jgi:hypothetical protein